MKTSRRKFLLGAPAALAATKAAAMPMFLPRGSGGGIPIPPPDPPPEGVFASVYVPNDSGDEMAVGSYVQVPHGIGEGDLPSGSRLVLTDSTGNTIPYTAARRAMWPDADTDISWLDLYAKLAAAIPAKRAISSLTISGTTATATTDGDHGLVTGDRVVVQATNNKAAIGRTNAYYCGLVAVTVTGATTFIYTVEGIAPLLSASVAMEMCYTQRLDLAAEAGSWNDTLPASKTQSDVLTDLQTNHPNITLRLRDLATRTGTTVGSGEYTADLFSCIAEAGTDQLRVQATGPTMMEIVGIMTFADTVGGARHSTLAGRFYVNLLLDPTTGDIDEVHFMPFVDQTLVNTAMGYFTYRVSVELDSDIAISYGVSTDTTVDGKMHDFLPAAVNTTANTIDLPNHKFQGGERVRFATTGTLPAPLVADSDCYVIWSNSNSIKIKTSVTSLNNSAQFGTQTAADLTTQGTGTHTITCHQQSPHATRQPVIDGEGRYIRLVGGTVTPIQHGVIHDVIYLQNAKHIPRINLGIDLADPVAERASSAINNGTYLGHFVYGSMGINIGSGIDAGGGAYYREYGAPFGEITSRRVRYPWDRNNAQTHRTAALSLCSWSFIYTKDQTTWRTPVANNGPNHSGTAYPDMPLPDPISRFSLDDGVFVTTYTAPSDATLNPAVPYYSGDHRYMLLPPLYLMEGRPEIHDLLVADACQTLTERGTTSLYVSPGMTTSSTKRHSIDGVTHYGVAPHIEHRTEAWSMNVLNQAQTLVSMTAPERPYIRDIMDDTLAIMRNLLVQAETGDPDWLMLGGWNVNTMRFGPGSRGDGSNGDYCSMLFEDYIGMVFSWLYSRYKTDDSLIVCQHLAKFFDNLYRVIHNSWFSSSTFFRIKRAAGSTSSPNAALTIPSLDEPIFPDQNLDGVMFLTDGTVWGMRPTSNRVSLQVFPEEGDWHKLNKHSSDNGVTGSFTVGPPEAPMHSMFYVRQVASPGTYWGWKYATTNSDGTIIPSYTPVSTTTSPTNIGTGTTSISTADVLTGFTTGYRRVVIESGAGREICAVTAGHGTATLTVTRAQYGTTALAHGTDATMYVPYMSNVYIDLQQRDTPFPPDGTGRGGNLPRFGYRTMQLQAIATYVAEGLIAREAYENCYAWWNDPNDSVADGDAAFSSANSLMHSHLPPP